ncbi:MAG TPA: bacterioferritin [Flexilinea sp.]|nr:bacterioferritin [Flexilinea sp.]
MKGSEKVIQALNANLKDEMTAIDQYILHAEMCEDWGYSKLHDSIEKRAITEMKHAEALIARILFLEGIPIISELGKLSIGKDVEEMMAFDHKAEYDAIQSYNNAIKVCVEEKDNGTKELFEATLKDEEDHIDWIESQIDQISQMGIQNYLAKQV